MTSLITVTVRARDDLDSARNSRSIERVSCGNSNSGGMKASRNCVNSGNCAGPNSNSSHSSSYQSSRSGALPMDTGFDLSPLAD